MLMALFNILIFPGFLFLFVMGITFEYVDRIIYARLQNRKGPPFFQPLADFIKLTAKEEIVPTGADAKLFKFMPVLAMTAAITAFFYIPLWGYSSDISLVCNVN